MTPSTGTIPLVLGVALVVLVTVTATSSHDQHRFSLPPNNATTTTTTATTTTTTTTTSSSSSSSRTVLDTTGLPPKLVVDEPEGAGRFEYIQLVSGSAAPATGVPSRTTKGPSAALIDPAMRTGLQFLVNLYNPHHWTIQDTAGATPACRGQIRTYLNALENGTTWAVQMTDASGRYSSQFFFGNDFWLGSHALCEELGTPYALSNPPWPVTFTVVQIKVHLDAVLTPHPRILHVGMCLPRTCDLKDLTGMLHSASRASPSAVIRASKSPSMEVVRIRRVPGPYVLLADTKLHILAGVSAAVLILMVAGAILEEVSKRTSSTQGDTEQQASQVAGVQEMQERPKKGTKADSKGTTTMAIPTRKSAEPHRQNPGIMVQIVVAFSPLSNGAKILNCEASDEENTLSAVHGLRFLSLAWVILVHTYLQVFAIAENKTLRTITERNFLFQTVSNATFSVDTFFFISGLLVSFLYFKSVSKMDKGDGGSKADRKATDEKKGDDLKSCLGKFGVLIGYRFVRLIPAYLFVLGMVELSMRWIHNNSVFEPKILDHLNCERYWWRNALFINSLFPKKDMCMLWSWYMSNDTQFYVIGVILLLFSSRYFRLVAGSLVTLLVSSWVTTAFVSVQYEYRARIQAPFDKFDELYDKPWTRLGPYLVGMITGYILFKTKSNFRMPIPVVLLGWALSLMSLASLVYGLLHHKLSIVTSAAYVSLGHTAWGVSLGWIVFACFTGYGGYINKVLSFRALQPLSRLTYCAYLLHPMIQVLTSYQMDGPLHLHNSLVLTLYFGNVVAAYFLSFVISLAFEAPIVRLLKVAISSKGGAD